jgi:hypothetical protein
MKRERMEDAISRATSPEAGAGVDAGASAQSRFPAATPRSPAPGTPLRRSGAQIPEPKPTGKPTIHHVASSN